jgi:cytochrome c553
MNKFLSSLSVLLVAGATVFSATAQEVTGDAKAGEKKIAMCIGCHGIIGYQASFPEIHKVPMISGQGAKYIVSALTAYKKGDRRHPSMRGIADNLTEQDMADIGAYYEAHGKVEGTTAPAKPPEAPARVNALLQKGACVSATATTSASRLTPAIPRLRANTPTISL